MMTGQNSGPPPDYDGGPYATEQAAKIIQHPNPPPPKKTLDDFALDWDVEDRFDKMKADVFVLAGLAIRGDVTVIHGPPGSGKTLITMRSLVDSITAGTIAGADVYYVNADDNYKGLLTKLRLAQKRGFRMLAPGQNDFTADILKNIMRIEIGKSEVAGKILILDTIKKFADTMSKSGVSKFMNLCREWVANGGTIIALAHCNKHRDLAGKLIHSGTQDLIDDPDCSYMLDITNNDGHTAFVEFECAKCRGDNAQKLAFTYFSKRGITYIERLASVRSLSQDEERTLQADAKISSLPEGPREVFDYLLSISPNHARPKEIADALGLGHEMVKNKMLPRLISTGLVNKRGRGMYEISDIG